MENVVLDIEGQVSEQSPPDFYKEFCDACPDLDPRTCRNYKNSLKFLSSRVPDITDLPAVLANLKLEDVSNSRRRSCLCALKSYSKRVLKDEELAVNLSEPYNASFQQMQKSRVKQGMTGRQKKNWVDFACLKREVKAQKKIVFSWDKNTLWSKAQFCQAQCCWIMMYMVSGRNSRNAIATVNYLGVGPNTMNTAAREITFTEYKYSKRKKLQPITVALPRDLWKLFSWLRKQHKLRNLTEGQLLYNMFWKPLTPNALSDYLSRECQIYLPCCKGKRMGTNLMRHIVASHQQRYEMSLVEKQSKANAMMHSVREHTLYRVSP